MKVVRSIPLLLEQLGSHLYRRTVGLVPTMGSLHAGHLELLRRARKDCERVVCSIFVNPLQFNEKEDYKNYPRALSSDTKQAEATGCDLLFFPKASDIYPSEPLLKMDFGAIAKSMEGKGRPGHFNGVAIVLSKLFHMVQPTVAYFGEKDWQQYLLAQRLVADLGFLLKVEAVPTVRDDSGLAFSSRNSRLSSTQRQQATALYTTLKWASSELQLGRSPLSVQAAAFDSLRHSPGVRPEYFEIVDSYTLAQVSDIRAHKFVSLLVAAEVGPVRLIDNLRIQPLNLANSNP